MTAAAAPAQRGIDVTLLERAPAFGEVGAGETLSPKAMRGIADLGVADAVIAAGVQPAHQRIQHWYDGRTLVTLKRSDMRGQYGAPYVYIRRADLHAILVDAARSAGTTLVTDAAVRAVEDRHVTLHDGRTLDFDRLIGADGLKSVVRALFESAAAHFTGHVALSIPHRQVSRIRAGQVSINCHGAIGTNIPFGGFRQSGWGREFGQEGLSAYLDIKAVTARL